MEHEFKPLENISRSQIVFDNIKNAIFSGKLKPGQPLVELQLAKTFNVSQSTIREALAQLEKFGLAVKIPHKGTSVTRLTKKEIQERIQLRSHLEEMACILASKNLVADDYEQLENYVYQISQAVLKNLYYELCRSDMDFHRYVWKKSNNFILYDTLDQIVLPLFAFVSIQRSTHSQNLMEVVTSHEEVLEALKSKDESYIRKVLKKHAQMAYADLTIFSTNSDK